MDFVHPEDISLVVREFNEFVQSGKIRNAVYRYRRIDGEYLWFETTGIILKDKNSNPDQILFNTRDITERKQSEDKLREALKEKEFLMKELIHEKLYQTGKVTEICCRDYFNDLLTSIFSSFTTGDMKLKNTIEDIFVPTKTAMSLGLLINEIATNAIKHGCND